MQPKVSVVIATYNRANLLVNAINSILKQDYDNVEIIVVNDGSTDDTHNILRPFIEKKEIKYYVQENSGRSVARNLGKGHATGKYLSFLDDDDELLPGFCSELVNVLERNECLDFAFCNAFMKTGQEKKVFSDFKGITRGNIVKRFIKGNFVPNMCFLYRRQSLQGIQFKSGLEWNEDYRFIAELLKKGNVDFLDEPLAIYNFHEGNTSQKNIYNMRVAEFEVLLVFLRKFYSDFLLRLYVKRIIRKKYKRYSKTLKSAREFSLLREIHAKLDLCQGLGYFFRLRMKKDNELLCDAGF